MAKIDVLLIGGRRGDAGLDIDENGEILTFDGLDVAGLDIDEGDAGDAPRSDERGLDVEARGERRRRRRDRRQGRPTGIEATVIFPKNRFIIP